MGYSGRYHAASLAAVFLALAIGILIGVGFGSDVITGTAESLEESLGSDLDEARDRIGELEDELDREGEFGRLAYPALVDNRLRGREVAIVAFGDLDDEDAVDVRSVLQAAGAGLQEIAVVREPADIDAAVDAVRDDSQKPLSRIAALELAGKRTGRLLVRGGGAFPALRSALLSRYSGEPGDVDGAVVLRLRPEDLSGREAEEIERLESALIAGLRGASSRPSSELPVVGVERSDAAESSVGFFDTHLIASVDNLDQLPGKVALVYALGCAEGNYGVKETADALLPDLLEPIGLACGTGDERQRGK
jgi:hypothetical protein